MSNVKRTGWIAVSARWVGTLEDLETVYSWDGTTQPTRALVISAGFDLFGSDDFNVGRIEDDRLVWFGWMDEEHPAEDRPEVATALGLLSDDASPQARR